MELASFVPWLDAASKLATLSAAGLAMWGINAWRRDFTGKRRIELAEETLELFYKASDAVRSMRSPFAYGSESDHIVRQDAESDMRFRARQTVAPLYKRYEAHTDLFSSVKAARYKVMARYGPSSEAPFRELNRLVNEILIAAQSYVMASDDYDQDYEPEEKKHRRENQREREALFWEHSDDDVVNRRLKDIVGSVERMCRPYIESKSKIKTWWQVKAGSIRSLLGKSSPSSTT